MSSNVVEAHMANAMGQSRMGDNQWPICGVRSANDGDLPTQAQDELRAYWIHLEQSGLGWQSVKGNHAAARRCIRALFESGREWRSECVGREEILYLRDHEFAGLTPDTVRWYILLYGRFLKLNAGNSIVEEMELRWPKTAVRPRVDWLTAEEAQHLLSVEMPIHEMAALRCMLCMGLRRIEVIRLRVDHVMEDGVIVRGKGTGGGRYRFVPYGEDAKHYLKMLMAWRAEAIEEATRLNPDYVAPPNLFLTRTPQPRAYSEAGNGFDKSILGNIRRISGVDFNGNHTLRRTFARSLYLSGVKIELVSSLLGHADTQTTLKYIGIADEDKTDAIGKLDFDGLKLGDRSKEDVKAQLMELISAL